MFYMFVREIFIWYIVTYLIEIFRDDLPNKVASMKEIMCIVSSFSPDLQLHQCRYQRPRDATGPIEREIHCNRSNRKNSRCNKVQQKEIHAPVSISDPEMYQCRYQKPRDVPVLISETQGCNRSNRKKYMHQC